MKICYEMKKKGKTIGLKKNFIQPREGKLYDMKVEIKFKIDVPNAGIVEMTGEELEKFHDELTKFLNDKWEVLRANDED
jgi:hypothetical protein